MSDQTLNCTDCSKQFAFTESEQAFFQSKGFSTPSRCPDCRAARKAARNSGSSYSGGSSSGYGSASSSGYGSGERQMYAVVCAQCGKNTEVPFSPRGDRPVYCSDCFRAQPGNSSGGRDSRSSGSGRRY